MDLVRKVYNALGSPSVNDIRKTSSMHPSSASVIINGQVHGACHRAEYYKWFSAETTNKIEPEYSLSAISGNYFHKMITDILRNTSHDTGIQVLSDEQSFYDHSLVLSGRIDLLLRDLTTGEIIGADIKTLSDYGAGISVLEPRIKDVLQCAIYLDQFNKHKAPDADPIKEWLILYFAREKNYRLNTYKHGSPFKIFWQFSISFNEDSFICWSSQTGNSGILPITIDDIYTRYEELIDCIHKNILPDRDFAYQYDNDTIVGKYKNKDLNKVNTTIVKEYLKTGAKGDVPIELGDIECKLCEYKNLCYSKDPDKFTIGAVPLYNIKSVQPSKITKEMF